MHLVSALDLFDITTVAVNDKEMEFSTDPKYKPG